MNLDKIILGQSLDDFLKETPKIDSIINELEESILSGYDLRSLGQGEAGEILLSEEARESHILLVGATGEGKSKFLEMLLRQDIDRGIGCCLLDPSDNGDTALKVLKYCAKIGYEKVLIIDPHDISFENKVPIFKPLHIIRHEDKTPNLFASTSVVGNLVDALQILWSRGFDQTPRISKYLPAVLTALYAADMTLAELSHFIDREANWKRDLILSHLPIDNPHRRNLRTAFSNVREWDGFLPTVNTFLPFLDPAMEIMVGSKKRGFNFQQLIKDGYVILVNLDSEGVWGQGVTAQQRLLGTLIINEIVHAISRIRYKNIAEGKKAWSGPYYLYIDEAADYTTQKITYILNRKRKTGLRLTLASLGFDGFPQDILGGVLRGCKIKALFNADADDLYKMIRRMYGGELSDRDVTYTLQQLKKQHCSIKINKQPPVLMKVADIPDVDVPSAVLKAFKQKIYNSPLYQTPKEAREEIKHRFDQATTRTRPNAPRPNDPVRPDRPSANPPAGGVQDGTDNQAPVVETPPVADKERGSKGNRKDVQRQKGAASSFVRKRKQDDE